MPSSKPRHRLACKILFGAIILMATILLGLVIYSIVQRHAEVRGSAGPLFQSAPGKEPGPVMMRPNKAP